MGMSRRERRMWLNQLGRINGEINGKTQRLMQSITEMRG